MVDPEVDSLFNAGQVTGVTPEGDHTRQAVASLRGYAYQTLAAAHAWIDLEPEGRLYLELAEDYAVVVKEAIAARQVKSTANPGSITLNSVGVRNAIVSFVELCRRNPRSRVELRFLTTAVIGTERSRADRPAGVAGLDYWNRVASGDDPEPLRRLLESDRFPPAVRDFVRRRSPNQLRCELIRRIRWECGTPDYATLREELEARLVVLGRDRFRLSSTEARGVADPLLYRILETSTQASAQDRVLTLTDLYCAIDGSTRISVPRAALDTLLRCAKTWQSATLTAVGVPTLASLEESNLVIEGENLPLPSGRIRRASIESAVGQALSRFGVAVIVGGTGVGKTAVSRVVAGIRGRKFFVVEFRNLDGSDLLTQLNRVFARAGTMPSSVVILDDINALADARVELSLARVIEAVRRRHCEVIITSYRAPASRTLSQVGLDSSCVVKCPRFSEDDVRELVAIRGGDPARWGRVAYLAGAGGHPQLTDAFVAGVSARGWRLADLEGFFRRGLSSKDTDAAQDGARRNLIAALPGMERTLLYRLSIVAGSFDRALALSIGALKPGEAAPGEALDRLVGPWIEEVGTDLLQVCPLAGDSGERMLSQEEQQRVHGTIASELSRKTRINVRDGNAILVHGLAGKHSRSLTTLAYAVTSSDESVREMLAESLFALRKLRKDKPIYPPDRSVSIWLRAAQFKLVVAKGEKREAGEVAVALFREVDEMEESEERRRLEVFALVTVLCTRGAATYVGGWVGLMCKLKALVACSSFMSSLVNKLESANRETKVAFFSVLFGIGMMEVNSVFQLETVIDELDKIDRGDRAVLLAPIDERFADYAELVHPSWEQRPPSAEEVRKVARRYGRMAETTSNWGVRALTAQLAVAQAIMLDEFGDDKDAALAVLERATVVLGDDVVLARAVARIHWRRGEHGTALASFRTVVDGISELNPIDQMYALREAAISGAKTADWECSSEWFRRARRAAGFAETDEVRAMGVGLGADAGVAAIEAGDIGEGLLALMRAVEELDSIDPAATLPGSYSHHVVRHATLWVNARVMNRDVRVAGRPVWLEAGACSNPEPAAAIRERPLGHVDLAWYLLAETEIAAGMDVGVQRRLDERLGQGRIPLLDLRLRLETMQAAIRSVDGEAFAKGLRAYVEAARYVSTEGGRLTELWSGLAPTRGEIPKMEELELTEDDAERAARGAILAFAVRAIIGERALAMDALECAVGDEMGPRHPGACVFRAWKGTPGALDGLEAELMRMGRELALGDYVEPQLFWAASARFLEWCVGSVFFGGLSAEMAKWQRARWERIVSTEGFRLVRPWRTVRRVTETLEGPLEDAEFLVEIVAAGAEAVGVRLGPEYTERLRRATAQRGSEAALRS